MGRKKLYKHTCNFCGRTFKRKCDITRHIQAAHPTEPTPQVEPAPISHAEPEPTPHTEPKPAPQVEPVRIEDTIKIEEPPTPPPPIEIPIPPPEPEPELPKKEIPPEIPEITETLEAEAWADFYELPYEMIAQLCRRFNIDYPKLTNEQRRRIGTALMRLQKRHPTLFKTWLLDIVDIGIVVAPFVLPLLAALGKRIAGK